MDIELKKFDDFTVTEKLEFNKLNDRYKGEFIPCVNQYNRDYYLYRPFNFSMRNLDGLPYIHKCSEYYNPVEYRGVFRYPNPSTNFSDSFKASVYYHGRESNVPYFPSRNAINTVFPCYAFTGAVDRELWPSNLYIQPELTLPKGTKYCYPVEQWNPIPNLTSGTSAGAVSTFRVVKMEVIGVITYGKDEHGRNLMPMLVIDEPDEPLEKRLSYNEEKMKWECYIDASFMVQLYVHGMGEYVKAPLTVRMFIEQVFEYRIPNIEYKLNALNPDLSYRELNFRTGLVPQNSEGIEYGNRNYIMNVNSNTIETGAIIYNMVSSGTNLNGDSVRPNWFVYNIWDKSNNKLSELHSVFDDGADKFEADTPEAITRMLDYFRNYDLNAYSFGATISDKIRISGAQIDKATPVLNMNNYYINVNSESPLNLFSVTDGAYCALINPYSKKVYFILVGSEIYYELDLNPFYNDTIDFFGFSISESSIYVGTRVDLSDTNKYAKLKINLKFKYPKLVFNTKKLNFSFIPCQTHCLGKGGIISKV